MTKYFTNSEIDTAIAGKADKASLGTMAAVDDAPSDGKTYGRKDGAWAEASGGGGGSTSWGSITGTLSSQTDLQNALNAKANTADLGSLADQDTVDYATEVTNKPTLGTMAAVNDAPSNSKEYVRKDGQWVEVSGPSAPEWGDITGSISNQTDLANILDSIDDELTDNLIIYQNISLSQTSSGQIMRIPATGTDSRITTGTIVLDIYFTKMGAIVKAPQWTRYDGYIIVEGGCDDSTCKADVTLAKVRNANITTGTIMAFQQYLRANEHLPNNTNLNDAKRLGFWWLSPSRTFSNKPASDVTGLLVLKAGADYYNSGIYQVAFSPSAIYLRNCNNGTWSTWKSFIGS